MLAHKRSDTAIRFLKAIDTDTVTTIDQADLMYIEVKDVKGELEVDFLADDDAKDLPGICTPNSSYPEGRLSKL